VTTNGESVEADSLDRVLGSVAAAAECEDVHGTARRNQCFRLPADPRILLVIRVDEHADRPEPTPDLRGIEHAPDGIRFVRQAALCGAVLPFRAPMTTTEISTSAFRSTAVRPSPIGLVVEAVRETLSRRRLIGYLVRADLKKKGADTLLGNLWWVIDPLLQMAVYVILVTVIRASSQPDYPLFIFSAILPWKWFTSSVGDSIQSVTSQERLIKQIHFPKIVLPVSAVVAGVVNFAFGLVALALLLVLFYADRISAFLVLVALVAAVQFVFTLAVSFVVGAINVFYRDVGNVSRHALRMWFYLSPALYSTEQLQRIASKEPIVGHLMSLNPFAVLFESYRAIIYNKTLPDFLGLAVLLCVSLVLVGLATIVFKRLEPAFAKVL
jgi:ABC-type polysaccharide/polyol phosphate export permease